LSRCRLAGTMVAMKAAGTAWITPPGRLSLGFRDVHLWFVPAAPPDLAEKDLELLVSPAEQDRSRMFARSTDRRRYLSARGALRKILAGYLQASPSSIAISYSASGKPFLHGVSAPPGQLHFNVSHDADTAVVAVSNGLKVGVDVERIRALPGRDEILADFFSGAEQDFVRSRGNGGDDAFFQVWTRREASSKAVGTRLIESFQRFSIPAMRYSPGGFPVRMPERAEEDAAAQEWWLRDFVPAPGHAGALCVEKENRAPAFWRFSW